MKYSIAARILPKGLRIGVTAIGLNKNDEAVTHLEKYLAMNPTNKENVESAKTLIPAIKQTTASAPPAPAKSSTKKK